MKITVQLEIETDDQTPPVVVEVATVQREGLTPETIGLTIHEAKTLLAQTQEALVAQQVAVFANQQCCCPQCGARQHVKGQHTLVLRTLFGKLTLPSPRLATCPCQAAERQSFSPLAALLVERTTPELRYLQAKWASLVSYGMTVDLLEEILPIQVSQTALIRQVQQVAERLESELGEEQAFFIAGCQRDWDALPIPDGPLWVCPCARRYQPQGWSVRGDCGQKHSGGGRFQSKCEPRC